MNGSLSFFFHIIGVGFIFIIVLGGWGLNRKLVAEKEPHLKLYVASLMRTIGLLSPFAALLLLVTGIGNMHNRYAGSDLHWYSEGWLVAKVIFFVIVVVNGSATGIVLSRKRSALIKQMSENKAPENAETALKGLNRQFTMFYFVQFVLVMIILLLSTFGSGKHPGSF